MARMSDPRLDPAVEAAAMAGCSESRLLLSRRAMLGVTAGLFSAAFIPKAASAASSDPRLLVVVLRGGMDGINVVVPHGDTAYPGMRGRIALGRSQTQSLDGFYGLNPALASFGAMYRRGEAAAVHATCTPVRNRSHFDCQDNLETGLPGIASNPTGWLNRLLQVMPAGTPIRSRGAIQVGEAPLLLRGPAPVLGWSPTWFSHPSSTVTSEVTGLYAKRDRELYGALQAGLRADALAESTAAGDDGNVSSFRKAFRGAGRLLSAPDGPRIAVMSVSNFDTHANQGATDGFLYGSLLELDTALKEFSDYAPLVWPNTVIVMATEFGRTVRINGGGGTDHGVGTVTLLAGGAVAGGKVFGEWPGIAAADLVDDSDLRATTDLRAVFKGVLRDHVGVPVTILDNTVFPQSQDVRPLDGLIKGGSASALARTASSVSSSTGAPAAVRPRSPIALYRAKHPV